MTFLGCSDPSSDSKWRTKKNRKTPGGSVKVFSLRIQESSFLSKYYSKILIIFLFIIFKHIIMNFLKSQSIVWCCRHSGFWYTLYLYYVIGSWPHSSRTSFFFLYTKNVINLFIKWVNSKETLLILLWLL